MNYDHKHQLAFLLSLAALPIGGCVISDGDDDGDSGDDTGSATQNTMTADDDSGSMTSPMTADDTATGTETVDDTGSSSGSADDTAGTTGGEIPAVCTEIGAHYEKCEFTDADEAVAQCVYYLVEQGYTGECLTANEEYYACLAAAPCKDFEAGNPCQEALDAASEVCLGGTESGSDSGGSESSTGG